MSQQLSRDQAPSSSIETPTTYLPVQPTQQSQAHCTKNSNELLTGGMSNAGDITLCLKESGDYNISNSVANQFKLSVRGRTDLYHFELGLYGERGWNFCPPPPCAPFLKALDDFVTYYKFTPLPNISEKVHLQKLCICSTPPSSQPVQSTQQSQAHDATPFVPGESPNNLCALPPNHDIVPPSMMTNNAAVVAALQEKRDNSKDKMLMECTKEVNERGHLLEKQPLYVDLSDIEDDTLMLFDKLVACGSKRNVEMAGLSKDNDSNSKRHKNVLDHAMPSSSSRYTAMSQEYSRDRETRTPSPSPTTSLTVQSTQLHDATLFVPSESPNDSYPLASNQDIVPLSIKYITVGCMPQEKAVNPILTTLMETTKKLNELRLQYKKPTGRLSTTEEIATYLKEFGSYNIKHIKNGRVMLMVRGHSDVYYYELSLHEGKGWTFYPLPPNGLWPFHKTIVELVNFHRTTPLPDIPEKLCLLDSIAPPASNTSEKLPYFSGLFNSRDKNDLRAKWKELLEMRQ